MKSLTLQKSSLFLLQSQHDISGVSWGRVQRSWTVSRGTCHDLDAADIDDEIFLGFNRLNSLQGEDGREEHDEFSASKGAFRPPTLEKLVLKWTGPIMGLSLKSIRKTQQHHISPNNYVISC